MIGKIFVKRALLGATALTVSVAGVVGSSATSFAAAPTAASNSTAAHCRPASQPDPGKSGSTPADRKDCHPALNLPIVSLAVKDTAKETGQTLQQVFVDVKQGQTLNQIAGDKATGVESDVMASVKSILDKAVSSGKITQAQEDTLLPKAQTRLDKVMSSDLSKYIKHPKGNATGNGSGNGNGSPKPNSQAF